MFALNPRRRPFLRKSCHRFSRCVEEHRVTTTCVVVSDRRKNLVCCPLASAQLSLCLALGSCHEGFLAWSCSDHWQAQTRAAFGARHRVQYETSCKGSLKPSFACSWLGSWLGWQKHKSLQQSWQTQNVQRSTEYLQPKNAGSREGSLHSVGRIYLGQATTAGRRSTHVVWPFVATTFARC